MISGKLSSNNSIWLIDGSSKLENERLSKRINIGYKNFVERTEIKVGTRKDALEEIQT